MTSKMFGLISILALSSIACDKIGSKNTRSSEPAAPIVINDVGGASDDATAAGEQSSTEGATADTGAALTGKDLYAKLCASCHQTLDKTDVPKAPIAKINNAIADEPTMAGLKDIPAKDLQAIADALSEVTPGKGKDKEEAAEEGDD